MTMDEAVTEALHLLLQRLPDLDENKTVMMLSLLETPEQMEEFINWLQETKKTTYRGALNQAMYITLKAEMEAEESN